MVSFETARFVVGKSLMEHDEISQISPTSTYCSESLVLASEPLGEFRF